MERNILKPVLAICSATILLAACLNSQATTYNFNIVYTGGTPGGSTPWATLTVSQTVANQVVMRLDAVNLINNEYISLFEYNILGAGAVTVASFNTAGGVDPTVGANNGFNFGSITDAGLNFNADVNFPPPPGNSPWKFSAGDDFEWTLSRTGLTVDDISVPMLMHVQALENGDSSKITTTVIGNTPLPDGGSTIALLGFALAGADYLRRRLVKA